MKTEERYILRKSAKWTLFILCVVSLFWFFFSLQATYAYSPDGTPADLKSGSRINAGAGSSSLLFQPGTGTSGGSDTSRLRMVFGTQATSVFGTGTTGYILPGTTTGLPFIDYLFSNGSSTFNFSGFGAVTINGGSIGTSSSFIAANNGIGTNTTLNNPTFKGVGTITASFGANGLVITPPEYASVNNATGELQSQIDGKQASLVNNSPGTITNVLGYTPPANTLGSLTVALGYTPPANTIGSITTALGYTPPANTQGSITTALGYTPTNLGNTIELGTETTGNTDNITEGSANKYYTDARVNVVIGSSSITSPQVSPKITFTSPANGQFLKIVDAQGNVENGTSSTTVDFSAVIGSATTNSNFQANLAKNGKVLVGLSDVIKLPATTTVQTAQSYGQLYNYSSLAGGLGAGHVFLSHFNTTGSIFSAIPASIALTALGNAVGTTTSIFSGNSLYCDGAGDGVGLGTALNGAFNQTFTIDFDIKVASLDLDVPFAMYASASTFFGIFCHTNGHTYLVCLNGGVDVFDYWIPNGNALIADNTKHHIEIDRNGSGFYVFIDGSLKNLSTNTAIGTTSIPSFGATCTAFIGGTSTSFAAYGGLTYNSISGYMDEFRVLNTTSHTGTFTSPSAAYTSSEVHTQYNAQYIDPVNGNVLMSTKTPGTATTEASVISFNATHTIIGSSTSAYAPTGTTTTGYKLLVDSGKGLSQDWVLTPSGSWVKTDLPGTPTTEVLGIIRTSAGHKFFYKDKVVSDEIVKTKSLEDYTKEDEQTELELFKEVHQGEYIEGVTGSRTVNFAKMEEDFRIIHKNNKSVEWNDGIIVSDKIDRLQLTKAYLEMNKMDGRNNTVNYGIEIDRNCPPEILDANGLPSMAKWQGFNFVAIKGLLELVDKINLELGSATAEIDKLKAIANP